MIEENDDASASQMIKQLKEKITLLESELSSYSLAKESLEQQLLASSQLYSDLITELQQKELELKKSAHKIQQDESFIESCFMSNPTPQFVTDSKGFIVRINNAVQSILGYETDALRGKVLDAVFKSDDLRRESKETMKKLGFQSAIYYQLYSQGDLHGQYLLKSHDDQFSPFLIRGSLFYDLNGMLLGSVFSALSIDELIQKELRLKDAEKVVNMLSNTANDAIIVINDEDTITTWNKAAENLFGYSLDEAIGSKMHDMIVTKEERDRFRMGLKQFRASGTGPAINVTRAVTAIKKNGAVFPCEVSVSADYIDGRWHAFGVVRDITQKLDNQKKLEQAREEALRASAAKSDFLAMMSHEIRTPLHGVIGLVDLVLKDKSLSAEQQQKLSLATSSAEVLLSIINDVLDLSKIEAGKMEIEMVEFNLLELLNNIVYVLASKTRGNDVQLHLDTTQLHSQNIRCDLNKVRQIVNNLIGNAIKFTASGHIMVTAKISQWESKAPALLTIEVIDTGVGIASDKLANLFEPFNQGDSTTTRQYGGTGLGLTICKLFCDLLGGTIKVDSSVGQGSCFTVSLPVTMPEQQPQHSPWDRASDLSSSITVQLIMADNIQRDLVCQQLQVWGATVAIADNASWLKSDVSITDLQPFDIVMLELNCIDTKRLESIKHITEHYLRKETKVFAINDVYHEDKFNLAKQLKLSGCFQAPITTWGLYWGIYTSYQQTSAVIDNQNRIGYIRLDGNSTAETELNKSRTASGTFLPVLVVEDNEVNQLVVKGELTNMNLNFEIVNNGLEAIQCLQRCPEQSFAAILMDCHMPVLDGYAATEKIRNGDAGEHYKTIPIIAMTADAMTQNQIRCHDAGMNDYIVKPFKPGAFEETLWHWLSPSSAKDEAKPTKEEHTSNTGQQNQPSKPVEPVVFPDNLKILEFSENISIQQSKQAFSQALRAFVRTSEQYIRLLESAYSPEQALKSAAMVHKLTAESGSLGFMQLYRFCEPLEGLTHGKRGVSEKEQEQLLKLLKASRQDALEVLQVNATRSKQPCLRELNELLAVLELKVKNCEMLPFELLLELEGFAKYGHQVPLLIKALEQYDYSAADKMIKQLRSTTDGG